MANQDSSSSWLGWFSSLLGATEEIEPTIRNMVQNQKDGQQKKRDSFLNTEEETKWKQASELLLSLGEPKPNSMTSCFPTTLLSCKSATQLNPVQQREQWDCGLACLEMILCWIRPTADYYVWMIQRVRTQSVWTVDLVMLLHEAAQGQFLFCTNKLSVNPELHSMQYYKQAFEQDSIRVEHHFEKLMAERIPVCELQYLPMSAVASLVRRIDTVAIVLVDNSVLLSQGDIRDGAREWSCYMGHYLILAGITDHDDFFVVYNPALQVDQSPTLISIDLIEQAWRAKGTDQDIIFVKRID